MATTPYTLAALTARTTSSTSSSVVLPKNLKALVFMLNTTVADTDAGDTLNVYIQESFDEGTTWHDRVSFTQKIGTDAAAKEYAVINCEVAPETERGAPTDATLAAASVLQGPVCPYIRAKWVIVNAGGVDQSFTFAITMLAIR